MTAGTTVDLGEIDLSDPRSYTVHEPYGIWRRLRAEGGVHRQEPAGGRAGFWVLTRYRDVVGVLRDVEGFTSEGGNVLEMLLAGGDPGAGRMLPVSDGRAHVDVRNVLSRAFSPRAMRGVVERVRTTTTNLVTAAVERGGCDVARDIAERVPMSTICDLLGVPSADRDDLLSLTKSALGSDDRDYDDLDARIARNEILLYFTDLVAERRRSPREDVVSLLANVEVDGAPLPDDTVVLNCYSLILGGDQTSRLSMTGAVLAFMEHRDEWRRLRNGAVSAETATEEILRWTSPAMHVGRRARASTTIGSGHIAAGDIVTLWLASANRDEHQFEAADTLDLGRSPNKHLTFGYGPHFCIGAHLGRAEVSALVCALRERVVDIEACGEPVAVRSTFFQGLSSLPVVLVG